MNLLCKIVALVAIAAVVGSPLAAQGDRVQSGVGPGSVVLEPGGMGNGPSRVEVVGQKEPQFELSSGGLLVDLWQLEDGWLASGHRPDDAGEEMLVVLGAGDGGTRELKPPEARKSLLRGGAVPFVADGELAGLAWLEGDEATGLAVRAATWDDDSWGPIEVISTPGPGSQTALTATVLADASWLLVWTAYDGEDDEVVWSRRSGGVWSRPRRVHEDNDTPDILPNVVAAGRGALLSWSWMDGSDYRLKLSVLRGDHWRELDFLGGRGSLFPSYFRTGDNLNLLFRTVEPASWTMLELDVNGRIWRRAVLAEDSRERPVVDEIGAARVQLRWPASGAAGPGPGRGATGSRTGAEARPEDRRVAVGWQVEP